MNIEIIRNTLYKSYLESFYNFCKVGIYTILIYLFPFYRFLRLFIYFIDYFIQDSKLCKFLDRVLVGILNIFIIDRNNKLEIIYSNFTYTALYTFFQPCKEFFLKQICIKKFLSLFQLNSLVYKSMMCTLFVCRLWEVRQQR